MRDTNHILTALIELKENISNEDISSEQAVCQLQDIEASANNINGSSTEDISDPLKSIMITFNINNYSDMTIFFTVRKTDVTILQETGDRQLCKNVKLFLEDDPFFFSGLERIKIDDEYYRLFFESMILNETVYTVMSLTLSYNFRSTRFHILCDILLDYILSVKHEKKGIFSDFFDDKMIEFSQFISAYDNNEPTVYLFRYEYISDFFNMTGLSTIIEISGEIKNRFKEIFGNEISIIPISLSNYIVIVPEINENESFKLITKKRKIDFVFKGIVLPYSVIQIPYQKGSSVYNIFENIYHLNNYKKK